LRMVTGFFLYAAMNWIQLNEVPKSLLPQWSLTSPACGLGGVVVRLLCVFQPSPHWSVPRTASLPPFRVPTQPLGYAPFQGPPFTLLFMLRTPHASTSPGGPLVDHSCSTPPPATCQSLSRFSLSRLLFPHCYLFGRISDPFYEFLRCLSMISPPLPSIDVFPSRFLMTLSVHSCCL